MMTALKEAKAVENLLTHKQPSSADSQFNTRHAIIQKEIIKGAWIKL